MRLLCLLFMFFFITVSKALYRNKKSISILNELNDYGINIPLRNYFGRLNGQISKRIQNTRRGQTNDERPHDGWLSLLGKKQHEEHQKHNRYGQKAFRNRRKYTDESGRSSSSSVEMARWREQFDEDWNREKNKTLELKSKIPPTAILNMAAARPWSMPCGDPMQHDQPWGTCTLPYECMTSLRLFKGDFQCGHTNFICCAALFTHHDMYQGLDLSFVDTGSSSTGERAKYAEKSCDIQYKKRHRQKIRNWKYRMRSKQRLKRMIKRLAHEIRKNLHRAFRNTSMDRKYKVKNMKKIIKLMKEKYREERLKLKSKVHDDIEKADTDLKVRLTNVNNLNSQYLTNETFRLLLNKFNLTIKDVKVLRRIPDELKPYLVSVMNESADARKFEEKVTETVDVIEETTPPVNRPRVLNESSAETDAYSGLDGKLSDAEEAELDEITPVPSANIDIESVTLPTKTRRFEGGIVGAERKYEKKLKREDYIGYDIEYGNLYY